MKLATLSASLLAVLLLASPRAEATPLPDRGLVPQAVPTLIETVQARRGGAAHRGSVARGPHGGTVVRPGYHPVQPGYRPVPVRPAWVRPPSYWWRPGTAVAAGAALGFVTAAAATAYATSAPPAPGYCWYYTDPQRTQGFWDVCPR